MLVVEGEVVNKKRTYRIYCEEGLQVRTKKSKKITQPRVPMLVPDAVNQRWSMDFVSDQLANGRRFCVLNVVDDFSREYVLKVVSFWMSGHRVAREPDLHGSPALTMRDRRLATTLQPRQTAPITRQKTTCRVREGSSLICSISHMAPCSNSGVRS